MREVMTGTEREPSEWGPGTDTLAPMRAVAAFATFTTVHVSAGIAVERVVAFLAIQGVVAAVDVAANGGGWAAGTAPTSGHMSGN